MEAELSEKQEDFVLVVNDLQVNYKSQGILVRAVNSVSFSIRPASILGIVGESGSGKSTIGLAIMKLLPRNGSTAGDISFLGDTIPKSNEKQMAKLRGTGMTMVFQEPMTSLNPVMTVGDQLVEAYLVRAARHRGKNYSRDSNHLYQTESFPASSSILSPSEAHFSSFSLLRSRLGFLSRGSETESQSKIPNQVLDALRKVRLDPERTPRKYPHQLSGGERQRVMIAMTYIMKPKLLIADEPTTALDVTTQAQILKLMIELRDDLGTAILFISHDLLVVAQVADEIAVMYAGDFVEKAQTEDLFKNPLHPYTKGLLESIPRTFKGEGRLTPIPGSQVGANMNSIQACKFRTRCKFAFATCSSQEPKLREVKPSHYVACHLY